MKGDADESVATVEEFPSIGLAYEIALESYDIAMRRSDAIDNSLDRLVAWVTTVTVAIVTILVGLKIPTESFASCWFTAAGICFLLSVIGALSAKHQGELQVIMPHQLRAKLWLSLTEWEFKSNTIYAAGEAFLKNIKYINVKYRLATLSTAFFVAEIVCMAGWVTSLHL